MGKAAHEQLEQVVADHIADEAAFRATSKAFNGEMAVFKAETEGALAGIHAKTDKILEQQANMMEFMKNVNIGLGIFRFSWNNAAKLGSFMGLLFGVYLFLKVGISGALAWFINSIKP